MDNGYMSVGPRYHGRLNGPCLSDGARWQLGFSRGEHKGKRGGKAWKTEDCLEQISRLRKISRLRQIPNCKRSGQFELITITHSP